MNNETRRSDPIQDKNESRSNPSTSAGPRTNEMRSRHVREEEKRSRREREKEKEREEQGRKEGYGYPLSRIPLVFCLVLCLFLVVCLFFPPFF